MKHQKSNRLITIGLLLITAAVFMASYNEWEDRQAGMRSEDIRERLESESVQEEEADSVYEQYPDMPMPVITIDGKEYIGTLKIPALSLELPVMSQWSYPDLKISPCRYQGSVYSRNMIVAGHNYRRHFGKLRSLTLGDEIRFSDADGNLFFYTVTDIEELPGTAVEEMEAGEWDLTLFTCTYGGKSRVTVRCSEKLP